MTAATRTTQPAAASRRQCLHCGTPFTPHHHAENFCCAGCEAVHNLIESQGLNHFYTLRKGIGEPVTPRAFEPHDWKPLEALAEAAIENAAALAHANSAPPKPQEPLIPQLTLGIEGLHCIGCRWLVAELFLQQPGHGAIEVDMENALIHFNWVAFAPPAIAKEQSRTTADSVVDSAADNTAAAGAAAGATDAKETAPITAAAIAANAGATPAVAGVFSLTTFARQLQSYGYLLHPPGQGSHGAGGGVGNDGGQPDLHHGKAGLSARKRLQPRLLLCGVFALNAILLSLPQRFGLTEADFPLLRLFGLLVFLCATIAVALSGSYFLQSSLRRGALPPAQATGGGTAASPQQRPPVRRRSCYDFGRGAAFALFGCYGAVLLGKGLNLPALPGADALAAISFLMLLIAYICKR